MTYRTALCFLFIVLFGFLSPLPAQAATFTADRLSDDNGACTPGDCSLREALLAAETTPEDDTIVLSPGVHTLSLPETTPGSLSGGDLEILLFNVEILAPDGATVDARGIDRVFRFLNSTSRVQGLTITGGDAGLGLGGGVYSESSQLELVDVWIVGNSAREGGGLAIELGTVNMISSTISGNTASESGGGIYLFGISAFTLGRLEVMNSTISGNEATFAGGAILIASAGELLLEYSTVANNRNRPGDSTIFGFLFDPRADAVHTLVEGTCTAGPDTSCIYLTARTDELPVPDLGIEPLSLNGGSTPTHPLLASSPAVDLVAPGEPCPATDQRGSSRPIDGDADGTLACDAGAFERTSPVPVAVPTLGYAAQCALMGLLALGGWIIIRRV